jgi:AcrR family transcriptional regulator
MVMTMSRGRARSRTRQLTAADWIAAATDVLVTDGMSAVAVEPLAERLGTTKGSFYHHFDSRDALIAAALREWESAQTEAVIERLQLIRDPRERLRTVMSAAIADVDGGRRDAGLFASATHPLVRPVVERVTARRLRYMADTFAELGLPKRRARHRARMLYLSYIGLHECFRAGLEPTFGDGELRAYADELLDALVPPKTQSIGR